MTGRITRAHTSTHTENHFFLSTADEFHRFSRKKKRRRWRARACWSSSNKQNGRRTTGLYGTVIDSVQIEKCGNLKKKDWQSTVRVRVEMKKTILSSSWKGIFAQAGDFPLVMKTGGKRKMAVLAELMSFGTSTRGVEFTARGGTEQRQANGNQ